MLRDYSTQKYTYPKEIQWGRTKVIQSVAQLDFQLAFLVGRGKDREGRGREGDTLLKGK